MARGSGLMVPVIGESTPVLFSFLDGVSMMPAEFAQKYGWKNDPGQVRLVP